MDSIWLIGSFFLFISSAHVIPLPSGKKSTANLTEDHFISDESLLFYHFQDSLLSSSSLWCVLLWIFLFTIAEVCWASEMFNIFIKFGKFWTLISSIILSAPLSFGTFSMCMLVSLMVSYRFLRICSFFFHYFSFCYSNWIISIYLQILRFFPMNQICCWACPVHFHFSYYTFQFQNI